MLRLPTRGLSRGLGSVTPDGPRGGRLDSFIMDASLTCVGADTLVIVVDALIAQMWGVSTAL
jgi:hypothetical protein